MMSPRMTTAALWLAATLLATLAVAGWRNAVPRPESLAGPDLRAPTDAYRTAPESLTRASAVIVARDPFRLERRPPTVAYEPEVGAVALAWLPDVARPTLVLKGLVGGPPWQAVLEGVPGRDGAVLVRRGDTLGALRVRAVGRDTVIVQGMDTTWRLTVRHLWP